MDDHRSDQHELSAIPKTPGQLQNALIVVLNALGPVGGALSSALSTYATGKRFDNIETMLHALRERLEQLPPESFQDVIASEEYVHLCVNAMEQAQREHREHKRKLLGVALANLASAEDFQFELSDHFIALLAEMNDPDLAIIRFLAERGLQQKEDTGWSTFDQVAVASNVEPRELAVSVLQRLAGYSVIKTKGGGSIMFGTNPVGLWYVSSYSITSTGLKFVEYLIQS